MDGHCAASIFGVKIARDKTMDIAIEVYPHDLRRAIDHGAAGVAANRIGGIDEIERRVEIYIGSARGDLGRDIEWRSIIEAGAAIVESAKCRLIGHERCAQFITSHDAEAETQ